MIFKFEPVRITKQLLLDNHTEEEYMSFYLGITPDKGLFRNPLRSDNRPTASFYRAANKELIFKDFMNGFHGNFVDIVIEKFGVGFQKALRIIANDFGIISKPDYPVNQRQAEWNGVVMEESGDTTIQCEVEEFSDRQLRWWASFGITPATLKRFHVFSVKNLFLNNNFLLSSSVANPTYGYYFGKKEGRELWKIYFPFKTGFRFLLNTNSLQGAKQLPKSGSVVVVTKSMKDVMTFYEMGVPAVAPQAESVIISGRQYAALARRFDIIIFNGDWDRAGQHFMAESRRRFRGIALAFTNPSTHAKDVSDYVKKVGFEQANEYVQNVIKLVLQGHFSKQYKYSALPD